MEDQLNLLCLKMTEFDADVPQRIQHFIKVHAFAKLIAEQECVDSDTAFILEAAAYVHDIGIKPAKEKYGSSDGKHQEKEGPAPARAMLTELGFPENVTERVCFLVAHHHTYTGVEGIDWQILLEADFLVNAFENSLEKDAVKSGENKFFVTASGKKLLETMFGL